MRVQQCYGYLQFPNYKEEPATLRAYPSRAQWFRGKGEIIIEPRPTPFLNGSKRSGIFRCVQLDHDQAAHVFVVTTTDRGRNVMNHKLHQEEMLLEVRLMKFVDSRAAPDHPTIKKVS